MLKSLKGAPTFILCLVSAGLCVLSVLIPTGEYLHGLFQRFGFGIFFVTFFYWLYCCLPSKVSRRQLTQAGQQYGWVLLLIATIVACMFMVSPVQFRILADETNLLGMANSMFHHHGIANITQSVHYYSQQHIVEYQWDVRPNFFPFLIYIVHTLKGYSAYNVFVVNYVAMVGGLFSLYWLLTRWFSSAIGLLGVMALAAYPLIVLWATSGGFEILNITMALLAFCFLYHYLQSRRFCDLERLVLTLVLLAQTRYESAIFVVAIGLVLLVSFRQQQLGSISVKAALWPWLMTPIVWQRLYKTDGADFQVYSSDEAMFGVHHFINHLGTTFEFFSAGEAWYGTVPLVFYGAALALVGGLWQLWLKHRLLNDSSKYVLLAASLSLLGLMAVIIGYYWGNLAQAFTIRLGIIFIPFVVVLFCYGVNALANMLYPNGGVSHKVALLLGFMACLYYWPIAAKNQGVELLSLNRQYQLTLAFLEKKYPENNHLIVTERPGMYTVHEWGAVGIGFANQNPAKLQTELNRRLYQQVLFIQTIDYDTGEATANSRVSKAFNLVPIYETQFDASSKVRISTLSQTN